MKLNNELLIIDLETTASQDEEGYQVNSDIIQIGAVLLSKDLYSLGEFSSLVKPRETVSQYITDLTGITDEQAQAARPFNEVFTEFDSWVAARVKNVKNTRICAWGCYFDLPILRRQYREYKMEYPYSGTGFDIKTLAFLWMSLSDHRTDKLSVAHVSKTMGLIPSGNYHNALVDARAEASILIRAMNDLNRGFFLNGQLYKIQSY